MPLSSPFKTNLFIYSVKISFYVTTLWRVLGCVWEKPKRRSWVESLHNTDPIQAQSNGVKNFQRVARW